MSDIQVRDLRFCNLEAGRYGTDFFFHDLRV